MLIIGDVTNTTVDNLTNAKTVYEIEMIAFESLYGGQFTLSTS